MAFLHHRPVLDAMDDPHAMPFVIDHDWSDVDPDPPDSHSDMVSPSLSDDDSVTTSMQNTL